MFSYNSYKALFTCARISFMKVIFVAHKNDTPVYFAIIAREAYKIAVVESK